MVSSRLSETLMCFLRPVEAISLVGLRGQWYAISNTNAFLSEQAMLMLDN